MSKILVHICCSVDSSYFIQELKKLYLNSKIIGFFYDPNIHPYSEYYLRMLDAKRSCKRAGVEFIEGEYDYNFWLNSIRGLENEPEKGKRCEVCFDLRLNVSAKKAKQLGCNIVTTTLLMSPKKDYNTLKAISSTIAKEFGVTFIYPDFRKNGGTNKQFALSKSEQNYHQTYCGCMFGLQKQREFKNTPLIELISPINKTILPNSIEQRVEIFEKRVEYEDKNQKYKSHM